MYLLDAQTVHHTALVGLDNHCVYRAAGLIAILVSFDPTLESPAAFWSVQPAFCCSWAQALDDPSLLDSTDGVAVATVEPYCLAGDLFFDFDTAQL